jgi:hypothetical protein
MSRKLAHITLLLVGCAACGRGSAQSSRETAAQIEPVAHVTIVGCVQPADSTARNGEGVNDTKYMLTHAKATGGNTNVAASTSGGSAPPESTRRSYRLNGSDATIGPEVGHQVEIVAVVEEPEPVPTGTSGKSATTAVPKVKVETIKMIAMPCPE